MLFRRAFALGTAVFFSLNLSIHAEPAQFRELYELLRANLTGASEADLNRAAVEGLIEQLGPKVALINGQTSISDGETNGHVASRASVFESAYGYLRLGQFDQGAAKRLMEAYRQLASTNRLKGLVLDLRYSQGENYAGALDLADNFFAKEEPLIDWGDGLKKATSKTNAVSLPITLLVNRKTSGAAEAFAAVLRQAQVGVIIGSNTAGHAAIAKEFVLSTGQKVRVATTPIRFADGKPIPSSGLKPDIYVEVNPEDELAWFEDSFKVLTRPTARAVTATGSGTNDLSNVFTNRSSRRRLNEAELVRMLREGINPETEVGSAARELERAKGIVSDPVLARALDLLKGLTVVQHFRSS